MSEGPGRIVSFQSLDAATQGLIKKAAEARLLAYAPYSNFLVGSALLTKQGNTHTGCNVENASYSMAICAERTALVKAVSSGERDAVKIAVVAEMGDTIVTPCGPCRQFIYEFAAHNDTLVYCSSPKFEKVLEVRISELLPWGFRLER